MTEKIKVFVVSHKSYSIPEEKCYQPIFVGDIKDKHILFNDESGDNIADKNANYCELTALYWVWKNASYKYEYIGFSHYRRYFSGSVDFLNRKISGERDFLNLLEKHDCIVPKKRNYYIETVYSHYANAHYAHDMDLVRKIISIKYPEYIPSFNDVMNGKELSLYNMFVMRRDDFCNYCKWLFDVLFELERKIDISSYDSYQKRVFGFIAERLFNIYLRKNNLNYIELKISHIEREKYFFKLVNFVARKLIN